MLRRNFSQALHTDSLEQPQCEALVHQEEDGQTLRLVRISGKDEDGVRRNKYIALSVFFSGRFPEIDAALAKNPHQPIGRLFKEKQTPSVQNRHWVRDVRWFLVPSLLRRLLPARAAWWTMECYTIYGITELGTLRLFGWTFEMSPAPRHLPGRGMFGIESVWRLGGRRNRFAEQVLTNERSTCRDTCLLALARGAGRATAGIRAAVLYRAIKKVAIKIVLS